jgi:hypothetical protein
MDEPAHLAAGLSHWRFGCFHLYHVNPPLVRLAAALPVWAVRPQTDWSLHPTTSAGRDEFSIGAKWLHINREQVRWFFALGRWACLPFGILGAVLCWRWGQALWGAQAGLLALLLWCMCPNLLGHGALLTPDVGGTALAVASGYVLWCWQREGSWESAVRAGMVLGLAQLAKFTNILLWAMVPLYGFLGCRHQDKGGWLRVLGQVGCIEVLVLGVINTGYGFEGAGKRLGNMHLSANSSQEETSQ